MVQQYLSGAHNAGLTNFCDVVYRPMTEGWRGP